MNTSPTIGKIAKALAAARAKFDAIKKTSEANIVTPKVNYSYKYADTGEILDACVPHLSACDLAIVATTELREIGGMAFAVVVMRLIHESDEWVEAESAVPCNVGKPQDVGGAYTYARRYALGMLLGVASEADDDANDIQHGGGYEVNKRANGPQTPATARSQPTAAPKAQTPVVGHPAKSDPLTTAKANFRKWVADLGVEEEHADTLRMLDVLSPDDFRPVHNRVKAQHAALAGK